MSIIGLRLTHESTVAGKAWRYDSGTQTMVVSAGNAAPEPSEAYLRPMLKWANNLFADTFG